MYEGIVRYEADNVVVTLQRGFLAYTSRVSSLLHHNVAAINFLVKLSYIVGLFEGSGLIMLS